MAFLEKLDFTVLISSLITLIGMGFTTYISYKTVKINNEYDFKKNVELSSYKTSETNYFTFKQSCMDFLASADKVTRLPPLGVAYDEYLANYRKVALECSDGTLSLMGDLNSVIDKPKYTNEDRSKMKEYLEFITLSLREDLKAMKEQNKADTLR